MGTKWLIERVDESGIPKWLTADSTWRIASDNAWVYSAVSARQFDTEKECINYLTGMQPYMPDWKVIATEHIFMLPVSTKENMN